jgi:hypothetical protein
VPEYRQHNDSGFLRWALGDSFDYPHIIRGLGPGVKGYVTIKKLVKINY